MSSPYVNMRSVAKKIDSAYLFQCSDVMSHVETVIFQVLHLTTLRTKAQFITGALAAASALHHGRFVKEVSLLLGGLDVNDPIPSDPPDGVFGGLATPAPPPGAEPPEEQSGEYDHATSYAAFVSRFKRHDPATCSHLMEQAGERYSERALSYWAIYKTAKNTPFLQQCRKIFALIMVGCMTSDDFSKSHPRLYKRVVEGTGAVGMDEYSIFEEVVELGLQTWTVVESCYYEESFSPLFGCSANLTKLEAEHSFLITHGNWYMLDEIERVSTAAGAPCTPAEFELRVKTLRRNLATQHLLCKHAAERLVLKKYLDSISALNARVVERLSRATMRPIPFAIKFDGATATGKSAITNTVLRDILRMQEEPHTDPYIAVINTAANHMDTLTNSTRGVIIDDLCNTLASMSKVDENRFIIDLLNMMQTPVLKAALEDKGQTFCRATALVVSTNSPKLQADMTSIEHSAVLRRFQFHILVTVKPGFEQDNGPGTLPMLDGSKMVDGMDTDAQEFVVRQWIPFARTAANSFKDSGEFRPLTGKLNRSQLMQFLKPYVLRHKAMQERMIQDMADDALDGLCEHGFTTAKRCHLCKVARAERPVLLEEAGEWWRWPGSAPDVPAPPLEIVQPTLVCAHGLTVCNTCHPSEDAPPRRVGVYERFINALVPEPPPEAPEPNIVRLCKAFANGRYDIEDTFMRAPGTLLTCIYGGLPGLSMSLTYGIFALFGLGGIVAHITASLIGLGTVNRISAGVVGWVRGRVAGLTLSELRGRMQKLVHRSMGSALILIFAGLTTAAFIHTARRYMESEEPGPAPAKGERPPQEQKVAESEVALSTAALTDIVSGQKPSDMYSTLDWDEQGACNSTPEPRPPSLPDPVERPNVWLRRDVITHQVVSPRLANMTTDQLLARVGSQLFLVDIFYESGRTVRTMAQGICTNHVCMPAHNFFRPDGTSSIITKMLFSRDIPEKDGTYECKFGKCSLVRMDGDMVLFQANIGGTMVDLTSLFTEFEECRVPYPAIELRRDFETAQLVRAGMPMKPATIVSSQYRIAYSGYEYTRQEETFKGLCGAVILFASKMPRIAGLHVLGKDKYGAACHISKKGLLLALEQMRKQAVVRAPPVNSHSTTVHTPPGHEASSVIGPLSKRSVIREIPNGTPVLAMGTLENYKQVRPRTGLHVSPISPLIEQSCGEVRQHGPPQTIGQVTVDKCKLAELEGLAQLPPDTLRMAQEDIYQERVALIEAGGMWPYMRPLTHREAVSGVIGSVFVRRINVHTSPGFPLAGDKMPLLKAAPTEEQPEGLENSDVTEAEIAELEDLMAEGERPCFAFKACHKDEAVKIGKKKTRVIEAAPYTLTFLTRKYFLPLMRMYFNAQLETGSAVGINAAGPEWHGLAMRLREFNRRLLEGDWQHFDSSEHYQEIMAYFTILMRIAERSGNYAERDIRIMWTIAEETARHYVVMRGDVAQIDGSNASGNALTVFINNGVNEGRMVTFFYAMAPLDVPAVPIQQYSGKTLAGFTLVPGSRNFAPLLPHLKGRFFDYVRCMFYGDDFLMAPRPEIESWFNQRALEAYFAEQGKKMTGADKLPMWRDFTPFEEASFLKRSFRFDDETQHYMAPLSMSSIYKPLHIWPMKLANIPEVHAAEVMGGAIRELFQHGRVVFEERVPKLLEVAKAFGADCYLAPECASYDAALADWLATYVEAPPLTE